ncbi:MFS general substrate transporter [Coprinellus micaceus]|uniref:MFS general substrate transporter n=1 Tax=Coprinellus micaceus TaxID=71717 RepID=A0A4Y7T888_COPMI|nr:MFS general substrate transporter [Coprinellus micaceus]
METGVNDKAIQAQAGFEEASPAYLLTLEDSVQKQFIKRTIRRVHCTRSCVIDRNNLGMARVAGMDHDLKLSAGARYSIVSCLFFIPYILLQLPSNVVLRKVGAVNWLTFCVTTWGVVQLSMGFVKSWGTLALCRTLLGVLEVRACPIQLAVPALASFYISSVVLGGFSAVLTYAITLLGGEHGIAAWRWIFIVEGVITIGFGVIGWFFLPDFPDQNRFLTAEQTGIILSRVETDRGDSVPDDFTTQKVYGHLRDWKIWAFGLMHFCSTIPVYAINFFLTNILIGMGWGMESCSAPPYLVALPATIVGLLLVSVSPRPSWKYVGTYTIGSGDSLCLILLSRQNNVVSHSKRGVTMAVPDAPGYLPGIYTTLGCQVLLLLLLGVTTIHFKERNIQVQQCPRAIPIEGKVGFEYTL